ncbi:MAG: hypothetical protein COB30_013685 [Ectothiorhodospiraceae bacterium]|nr:hypothetical protein [Ectothiorhodospiraceae bacterium]
MKSYRLSLLFITLSLVTTCTTANNSVKNSNLKPDELLEFAEANCMFWYFKKMDYDLKDIRAISGGIVKMGSYSANTYQNVALLVKGYTPTLLSKQNVDVNLWKCFKFGSDGVFMEKLNNLK